MPEGDTVYNAAARLDAALAGRVLTGSDFRVPRFATLDLRGRTVDSVTARGKHLLIRVGAATVHSHLKMEGVWHVYRPRERWRRPAHTARAILKVDGAEAVGFSLGKLEVLSDAEVDQALANLGPDPLGPNWDAGLAATNLATAGDRAVGHALLDQRNLAGVGNVFRNELCFLHGVHPATPMRDCGDPMRWAEDAARLLRVNRGRSMRLTTGVDRPGKRAFVYGRARLPCLRCGSPIRAGTLGGEKEFDRSIWWCPTCQKTATN